jgi:hypothetical protein
MGYGCAASRNRHYGTYDGAVGKKYEVVD